MTLTLSDGLLSTSYNFYIFVTNTAPTLISPPTVVNLAINVTGTYQF
jgi:hypothetical protein